MAEGEGRKDGATARLSGRAPDNRLVHFALPPGVPDADVPRPGDVATVQVTYGAPHHLVADAAVTEGTFTVRRTRAGDAWARRRAAAARQTQVSGHPSGGSVHPSGGSGDPAGGSGDPAGGSVLLGMPALRRA